MEGRVEGSKGITIINSNSMVIGIIITVKIIDIIITNIIITIINKIIIIILVNNITIIINRTIIIVILTIRTKPNNSRVTSMATQIRL